MAYERYKIVRGRARQNLGEGLYSYQPPGLQEIIKIQKDQINDWQNNALTLKQRKMLEQIMGIAHVKQADFNSQITKKLDLIEEWAAALWQKGEYKKENLNKSSVEKVKTLYTNLLNNWKQILELFKASGLVNAQAKAQLDKFEIQVDALEQAIESGGPIDYSIISRAISAANFAKGYVLEHEGKNFYSSIFKDLDVEVVSTGQMKSNRGRGAVDLAQDIVIVSKGTKYQNIKLRDFLDRVGTESYSHSVILSDEEQMLLQQGIGIQAKASRNKIIRLKNAGMSVGELMNLARSDGSVHGTILQMLFSAADKGEVYIAHPDYAAIGNYLMSKQLKNYLGNNMLYLLRDGLYDTYSLFNNQLSKNNYAQILNGKLHLSKGCGAFGLRVI